MFDELPSPDDAKNFAAILNDPAPPTPHFSAPPAMCPLVQLPYAAYDEATEISQFFMSPGSRRWPCTHKSPPDDELW
jgi:hypothetical protein